MSWILDTKLNPLQKLCINVIKTGYIPRHIAIIMDGNRRYANKNKVLKVEGHSRGFDKLTEVLRWCLDIGIIEVTVYAFSIENFKRSEDEVNQIMNLARRKFEKLLEEKDKLIKEGVNIRVIGDLSLLPHDLFQLISKAVYLTKDNTKVRLTVAFSYTGQNEICESIRCISKGVKEERLKLSDISMDLLGKSLYSENSDVPDLVIRTSGEVRISDFMLWQSSYSCYYFTSILWPEFTFWELLKAIFFYQRSYKILNKLKIKDCDTINNERTIKFLSDLYSERLDKMKKVIS
ncbi:Dehydrodolichyl diphosphate synthase, putative [Pediculus humanus corporis]|uniref:Alkyl transferase n=1 Tax=Pediculus humanus subsp. corporis TaxID=121224 RepID=E0VJZ5_PEDHC|nr:Dehydrodolichyl diphosphate synthase, putative [Pediculus humanus corporis]EEB13701.1 Dehydrodolichyl diphosphate synthase, putative [Pediculus humanus corporis]